MIGLLVEPQTEVLECCVFGEGMPNVGRSDGGDLVVRQVQAGQLKRWRVEVEGKGGSGEGV